MPAATSARSNRWNARCGLRRLDHRAQAVSGHDPRTIDFFEAEGDFRIKVNPLAHWGRED
jgi:hypothetical protein